MYSNTLHSDLGVKRTLLCALTSGIGGWVSPLTWGARTVSLRTRRHGGAIPTGVGRAQNRVGTRCHRQAPCLFRLVASIPGFHHLRVVPSASAGRAWEGVFRTPYAMPLYSSSVTGKGFGRWLISTSDTCAYVYIRTYTSNDFF